MKNIFATIIALAVGIIIGFFGVFNSVFSDGAMDERLIFIAILLAVYVVLGAVFGIILPGHIWKWVLLLGLPGALCLLMFMLLEHSLLGYLILYIVLLLAAAFLGVWGGDRLKKRLRAKK